MAIGLSAPVYVSALQASGETARGLGDVRLALPTSLLAAPGGSGLGISLVPALDLPTGNAEQNLGRGMVRAGGWIALGYGQSSSAIESSKGDWSFAMNIGVTGSPSSSDTPGGANQLLASAGGSYLVMDSLALALELTAEPSLSDAVPLERAQPQEALLSARGALSPGLGWTGGYARTLSQGNSSPLYRVLLGLSWAPVPEVVEPPPPPPPRTSAPVRLSVLDAKGNPVVAEVRLNGDAVLPPVTLGETGSIDQELSFGKWRAMISAADYGTTLTDFVVKEDQEGLLEIQIILHQARVRLEDNELVILEKVHFDVDKDQVKPESLSLLQEVAAILLSHPEIARIEIQGHTDDQGDDAYNLDLSQRRVESVRQLLIVQGVEADRLEARGYGESKPIAEGQNEEARAANRRVQFLIVETRE
jgi:outer membrane protein OmpA-like peptidoglycan-associated protein